ncbi:MAG TPA: HepT-like ribonuclease domain-containing protein [Actinomycetota bacterium]|nr:HepT-like ribonuclease domain-containing protein [Actinomycetota bacterium]
MKRPADKLLDDIIPAAAVAGEVGRIGDAASKLPEEVRTAMPDIPWKEIIGLRIVVDHAYHGRVWNTLSEDVPRPRAAIERYRGRA